MVRSLIAGMDSSGSSDDLMFNDDSDLCLYPIELNKVKPITDPKAFKNAYAMLGYSRPEGELLEEEKEKPKTDDDDEDVKEEEVDIVFVKPKPFFFYDLLANKRKNI